MSFQAHAAVKAAWAAERRREYRLWRKVVVGTIKRALRQRTWPEEGGGHVWIIGIEAMPRTWNYRLEVTCQRCGYSGHSPYASARHVARRSWTKPAFRAATSGALPCRHEAAVRGVMSL